MNNIKNISKNKSEKSIFRDTLIVTIIGVVIVFGLIQLFLTHYLSNNGDKLKQIENQINILETKNLLLADENNKLGSLAEINQKAKNLGLVKTTAIANFSQRYVATSN